MFILVTIITLNGQKIYIPGLEIGIRQCYTLLLHRGRNGYNRMQEGNMQRTHRAHYHHSRAIEMTSGSLWKNILLFSIPLVLTQLLEILFNLSDVAVAGKFADYRALGAVGSTTQLVTLFTGFLIGLGSGVNVEVARSLGAEDKERTEKNIHTSFIICAAVGVLLYLICRVFARDLLVLLHTKDELLEGAVLYFSIYALGLPAMAVYNFGNGVLSAAGDTKRPLLYLTVSGILNVILNLFFVIKCHMAADGVAIASVIAQVLSAVMITVHLCRRNDDCRLSFSKLRFNGQSASRVLMLGIPTGLQHAIFAVANMFVQAGLNTFDAVTVSGNSASVNADELIFNTQAAFYTACSSFISRNWGAGRKERILKSYIASLTYAFAAGAICGVLLLGFGREFLSIFANEQAVIDAGMQRIKIMCFSYGVGAFMDCSIAAARGLGKSIVPMIIVVLGSCVFRVVWIYTVFAFYKTIPALYLLYIFSWAITGAAETLYFRRVYRQCMAGTLA